MSSTDTPRRICIVTGTRADYGILSNLMRRLRSDSRVELQIIATNMHLSPEFGLTYREIEADGFSIDRRVEMLLSSDTPVGTVKSMGLAMTGMADALDQLRPDLIVILGDRYEMLAAASAAVVMGIPVAHLHGGEITEGAYDDSVRHAITKLSYLHLTSTAEYRRRVIQMGEEPDRVHWVGAPALDGIRQRAAMPPDELSCSIGFNLGDDFLLVTFHPATLEPGMAAGQTRDLLEALGEHTSAHGRRLLFTMPNSDAEGRLVSSIITEWVATHADIAVAVTSLGRDRYHAALTHCTAVVGNSSSGLIEAPSLGKPTLNIGDRQRGRALGNTVINCPADRASIALGLERVTSPGFISAAAREGVNPYERPGSVDAIHKLLVETPLSVSKRFYDL